MKLHGGHLPVTRGPLQENAIPPTPRLSEAGHTDTEEDKMGKARVGISVGISSGGSLMGVFVVSQPVCIQEPHK